MTVTDYPPFAAPNKRVPQEDLPEHVRRFAARFGEDCDVIYYGENIAVVKRPGGSWSDNSGQNYTSPWVEEIYLKRSGFNLQRHTLFRIGRKHPVKALVGKARRQLVADARVMDANEGQYLRDKAKADEAAEADKRRLLDQTREATAVVIDTLVGQGWSHLPKTTLRDSNKHYTTLKKDMTPDWMSINGSPYRATVNIRMEAPNGARIVVGVVNGDVGIQCTRMPSGDPLEIAAALAEL